MRKSLFISLFMLAIGSFPAVQAQHEPAPPDAAALMAAYEVLRDTADNGQKLEHLFRAEEALAANTPAGVRWALHRELATVLYDLGAYDLAFQQMRLELEAAQANADTVSIARAVSAIGSRMMEQQQLDSALYYLSRSLRLAPRDDAYTLSGLYNNMAILHLNRREPDIADRYLDTVATLLGTTVPEFVDIRFSLRDNRADAALLNGDSARARALVAENLSVLLRYLDRDPDVQGRFVALQHQAGLPVACGWEHPAGRRCVGYLASAPPRPFGRDAA